MIEPDDHEHDPKIILPHVHNILCYAEAGQLDCQLALKAAVKMIDQIRFPGE
jgi:hypothetical protein